MPAARGYPLSVALLFSLSLAAGAGEPVPRADAARPQTFEGQVVPLAGLLKEAGATLDPAAAPHWLTLVTPAGQVYPLIRDDRARMFFTDPTTLRRPMRVTGRLFKDTRLLQVLDVHSLRDGRVYDIYYWCDICAIRRSSGGVCECCGGPMMLKEEPLQK